MASAYFPDWAGNLWALNARNGNVVWSHQFSDYGLPANTHSRTSPTVADGVLFIGDVESLGWSYLVVNEPPPIRLANVRFLAGYRREWLVNHPS